MRYSIFNLVRNAISHHEKWPRVWRDPDPKPRYDVIIIGGGGHGLATAYYLAKEHGISNIAVLEKGWIGGGNAGRNTTIIRSNYLNVPNARFYDFSIKLWETMSQELNFNVMFSQRGVLSLAHSDAQMDSYARLGNSMLLTGGDSELLGLDEVRQLAPYIDFSANARFPIFGGLLQRRGGNARHDAVVWGYARGADSRGVDIIQNCEVTGFTTENGRVTGVETNRGPIASGKIAMAVAGHTSQVAAMAGLRLPLETHLLQAMVTEPVGPFIDHVLSYGAGHFHVNQTDKGGLVMGGDLDGYNSYSQRGGLPIVERVAGAARSLIPALGRLHILRQWAGVMDMTMDGSPIICQSPIAGLFINGGWCYGGFKTIPASGWCYADTIANDRPHELIAAYSLDRFNRGFLMEEKAHGPVPNLH
jgi:sarcosine oxidase subunit beta